MPAKQALFNALRILPLGLHCNLLYRRLGLICKRSNLVKKLFSSCGMLEDNKRRAQVCSPSPLCCTALYTSVEALLHGDAGPRLRSGRKRTRTFRRNEHRAGARFPGPAARRRSSSRFGKQNGPSDRANFRGSFCCPTPHGTRPYAPLALAHTAMQRQIGRRCTGRISVAVGQLEENITTLLLSPVLMCKPPAFPAWYTLNGGIS